MTESVGRLTSPPVVYVLGQIRFSTVLKMAEYIPAIQEALRTDYPRYEHQQIGALDIATAAGPPTQTISSRWTFQHKDQHFGFILDQSSLLFHTNNYLDFPDFRDRLLDGAVKIHEIVNMPLIERVGLRYIDLITTQGGEALDKYVSPHLLGFSLPDLKLKSEVNQQVIGGKTRVGRLLVRFTRARHTTALPPDLVATALPMRRKPDSKTESAFLDIDHFTQTNIDFDVDNLSRLTNRIQAPINKVFTAAVTDYALTQWR